MTHVLVVDDDPGIVALVSYKLTRSGFEVDSVGDGQSAVDYVQTRRPDLVMLDVMMPGLSGLEVLERLRANENTARLPVIMLTAMAQEGDVERGFELGADDYIVKPFSPRELIGRVNAVLSRSGR